jgi:hypothetical protein
LDQEIKFDPAMRQVIEDLISRNRVAPRKRSDPTAVLSLLEAKSDAPAGGAPHRQDLTPTIAFEAVGFAYPSRAATPIAG